MYTCILRSPNGQSGINYEGSCKTTSQVLQGTIELLCNLLRGEPHLETLCVVQAVSLQDMFSPRHCFQNDTDLYGGDLFMSSQSIVCIFVFSFFFFFSFCKDACVSRLLVFSFDKCFFYIMAIQYNIRNVKQAIIIQVIDKYRVLCNDTVPIMTIHSYCNS